VPKAQQGVAKEMVRLIPYAETKEKAEKRKGDFAAWCEQRGYLGAIATIERDWEQLTTFYRFPQEHWKHLRTTNPVESPFAALRLRTDAAKRYKRVDRATALIWKLLLVGEKRFRRLNAPHLLQNVYQGVRFEDGRRKGQAKAEEKEAVAA
jgi:putative transposase